MTVLAPLEAYLLPFLKKKDVSQPGIIIKTRAPDEIESEESDDSAAGIEACAQSLISAIHANDSKAAANAIKDAFDILQNGPSEEYESKHDYDSQNIKAAEEQE